MGLYSYSDFTSLEEKINLLKDINTISSVRYNVINQSPKGFPDTFENGCKILISVPLGDWFIMGVAGFYGEDINGDWTLKVTDYTDNGDDGILIDWGINVFGN